MPEAEVLVNKKSNGVAILTLNRPNVLNSLNINMVRILYDNLRKWESDTSVKFIIINSSAQKAFCAGGDIKSIYEASDSVEIRQLAEDFFIEEYKLDEYLYNYSKPIIANLNGIIMGGGVGLTYGVPFRIITDKTRWSMPEINLGFFPDVGAGYFMNKMPKNIGIYLALTGEMISGLDIIYANAADYLIPANQIEECMKDIMEDTDYNDETLNEQLKQKFEKYCLAYTESELEKKSKLINKHFQYHTVEEIVSSLKNDESDFAQKYYKSLLVSSPVSLKVILKQLIEYKNKSINESLEMDKILVTNFLNHSDFYEGVRSVLIDKDRKPEYEYLTLEEVSDSFVNSFFK